MRGADDRSDFLFSYVSPEHRVPADHPLRPIRTMADAALAHPVAAARDDVLDDGSSIPPEQLLRALLLQHLYSHARCAGLVRAGARELSAEPVRAKKALPASSNCSRALRPKPRHSSHTKQQGICPALAGLASAVLWMPASDDRSLFENHHACLEQSRPVRPRSNGTGSPL